MKYVQKYRDFAKKHPVAQSLIYSALIAAAGISTAGVGGAAAVGLFKLVDKLLQGEKFSSAAYSGAKTGAMAYGASKIGDLIKGTPDVSTAASSVASARAAQDAAFKAANDSVKELIAANGVNSYNDVLDLTDNIVGATGEGLTQMGKDLLTKQVRAQLMQQLQDGGGSAVGTAANAASNVATSAVSDFAGNVSGITIDQIMATPEFQQTLAKGMARAGNSPYMIQAAKQAAMAAGKAAVAKAAGVNESIDLTESQIYLVIGKILERQRKLDEGIWDSVKGAASKAVGSAVDWAKTKGANLTTKITADKLLQAWKKAGNPTDSEAVAKVMQDAGVPSASVKQVYGTMKIPFAGVPGANPATPVANPAAPAAPAAPVAKPAAPVAKPAAPQATSTTAGAPSKVTYGGLLAPKKSAAPVTNFSKTGFSGYQTATAKPPAVAAEDASWGMAPESKRYRK
jgi:hypothetical protein